MRFLLCWLLLLAPVGHAGSKAEALLLQGRVEQALPEAKAEAEAAPSDLGANERYIDILLSLGMPGVAIDTYSARAQKQGDADSWYLLGRAVTTADEAEADYEKALAKDPKHARSYMGLGAVYRAEHKLDDAVTAYQKALALDPTLGEAWAGLGAAYLGKGDPDAALAAARKGMIHVPDEADSYLAVAVLAPDEAESVLKQAEERVPGDSRVHAALAQTLLENGDGAGAEHEAEAALAIDPTSADARLSRMFATSMAAGHLDGAGYEALVKARALEDSDKTEARAAYDKLVAKYPKTPLTWMGRARVRASGGDVDGSLSDLEQALEADPGNIEAMGAAGMLLSENGRATEALPLLKRASTERPQDASLAMAYAKTLRATGSKDAAMTTLTAAEKEHPYDARLILTHAKWLAEEKRSQEAYTLLKDAVKRLPRDDRVVLALAAAAKDLGKTSEAADLIDVLAERSDNQQLRDLAKKLRAGAL